MNSIYHKTVKAPNEIFSGSPKSDLLCRSPPFRSRLWRCVAYAFVSLAHFEGFTAVIIKEKQKMVKAELKTQVEYGISPPCVATLPRPAVRRMTARGLIQTVAKTPQNSSQAERTARFLNSAICAGRELDAEVSLGPNPDRKPGRTVDLDGPVLPSGRATIERDTLTVRVSEPYIGG
jgi:hypothetical protein